VSDDPQSLDKSDDKSIGTWSVWRLDEDGRDRLIKAGLSEDAARELVAAYKSMGHECVRYKREPR
jgi:hypothetical protein